MHTGISAVFGATFLCNGLSTNLAGDDAMKMQSTLTFMMTFAILATVAIVGERQALADDKKAADQKIEAMCPVMDEPVDPSLMIATDDGPVLVCCGGCIGKYKENPEKYVLKTLALRKAMEKMPKTQVTCPVSGEPVDTKVFTEKDDNKVYFCCEKCQEKYDADPAKYKSKLANSFSYQPGCPISGEAINPAEFVEFTTGQTVYFCCGRCKSKFAAAPEEHVDGLKDMGIYVKADKLKKDS